jgi:hypothetical protein
LFCLLLSGTRQLSADEAEARFSGAPVAVLRTSAGDPLRLRRHLERIAADFGIEDQVGLDSIGDTAPEQSAAITRGGLVYLLSGATPGAALVFFREVRDEEQFRELVVRDAQLLDAKVSGGGQHYVLEWDESFTVAVMDATGSQDSVESSEAAEPREERPELQRIGVDFEVSAGEPVRYEEIRESFRKEFRYEAGFLFQSDAPGLMTADLPVASELRQMQNSDVDVELSVHPDNVPHQLRTMLNNAWGVVAGAQMQRQDDETADSYGVRRSVGDALNTLVEGLLFDISTASGWLRTGGDTDPLRGQMRVEFRERSRLAGCFRDLGNGASVFGPIVDDGAPVTLHLSLRLPQELKAIGLALLGGARGSSQTSAASESSKADEWPLQMLKATLAAGQLEFLVKCRVDEDGWPVCYGGMQIHGSQPSGSQLESVLTGTLGKATRKAFGETEMLVFSKLGSGTETEAGEEPEIDSLALAFADHAAWFAVGVQGCESRLVDCLTAIRGAEGAVQRPCLTLHIDFSSLGALAEKLAPGLDRSVLLDLCFPWAGIGEFTGDLPENALLGPGGSELRLELRANDSGITVDWRAGAALVRTVTALALLGAWDLDLSGFGE